MVKNRNLNKTFSVRPDEIERKWYIVDAEEVVLGRLASLVAMRLMGKHKPTYTPNLDCGDNIVIINADKVKLTGNKLERKQYFKHTGHPGGIKSTTPAKVLEGKHPERVIMTAVDGMLGRGPLARKQAKKLFIYAGSEHPHTAQKPEVLDIASMNDKNKRS